MQDESLDTLFAGNLFDSSHDRTPESFTTALREDRDPLDFARPVVERAKPSCTDGRAACIGRCEVDRRLVVFVDLDLGVDALFLDEDPLANREGILVDRRRTTDANLPVHGPG